MKKIIILLAVTLSAFSYSQNYNATNDLLAKVETKTKKVPIVNIDAIINKKFLLIQSFDDHSERHILELNADNSIRLIELIEDKATGKTYSNIFTGDFVLSKNALSVKANLLEGKKIVKPVVYNFYVMNAKKIWYLKDINTNNRWLPAKQE